MHDLSQRQLKILETIIEENIQTGQPVGSDTLDKKHNLGISPATIRNEMVKLEKKGFLVKPHTSGGRLPTSPALKIYIKQLMKEKQLSVADEVAAKEKIWDVRHELGKLLSETVKILAKKTNSLAIATTNMGDTYHSGYSNLLVLPEFYDIDVARTVLSIIEDCALMNKIFSKVVGDESVHVLLGTDVEMEYLEPCGMVFANFDSSSVKGSIGVIGPSRFDYPWIIPNVRYFGKLINEVLKNW